MPGSCLDQAGSSLDGTGWKTPQLHINVTANLWRNDCNSLVLSIVPSRLLSRPGFHINSPLAIPSQLSYKQLLAYFMAENGLQFWDFHMWNWNYRKSFSGWSEIYFIQWSFQVHIGLQKCDFHLKIILYDCQKAQDDAVWILT